LGILNFDPTHTHFERRWAPPVVRSPVKGYKECEAIQLLLPPGPPTIKMVMGLKKYDLTITKELTILAG